MPAIIQQLERLEVQNKSDFRRVAQEIDQGENVYFITYTGWKSHVQEFQEAMMMHGKLIQLLDQLFVSEYSVKKQDCVVLFSMDGGTYLGNHEEYDALPAKKILITQSREEKIFSAFDIVVSLPKCNIRSIHKYTIHRILEMILTEYHELSLSKLDE